MDSLRGQLLVASPSLLDPNFRRTVILVTEHNEDGAAGLVLNRPSVVEVAVVDGRRKQGRETPARRVERRPRVAQAVRLRAPLEDPLVLLR